MVFGGGRIRHSTIGFLLIFALCVLSISACDSKRVVTRTVEELREPGHVALLREAKRQLANMKTSKYSHQTYVDEQRGIYHYDCSGFVAYALEQVRPEALLAIHHQYKPLQADQR